MPEAEAIKTEEALQAATFKTKAVFEQLAQGDVRSVWEKMWDSFKGDILHFGKIVLLAAIILIIAYFINKLTHKAFGKAAEKYALDVSLVSIINRVLTLIAMAFALLIILELLGINTASVLTVVGAAGLQGVERHPAARLVSGALVVVQFDLDGDLGLLRQVFEDVALDAAQDERGDEPLQRGRGASFRRKPPREVAQRAEQPRVEEVADAP